jgi:hypothetical protein
MIHLNKKQVPFGFFSEKFFFGQKATSTVEYIALVTFILAALFIFRTYIIRGLSGKWKATSDTFGFGRQFDPRPFGSNGEGGGTLDCYYDAASGRWLDRYYVDTHCDCTIPPEDPTYAARCTGCKTAGENPLCAQEE